MFFFTFHHSTLPGFCPGVPSLIWSRLWKGPKAVGGHLVSWSGGPMLNLGAPFMQIKNGSFKHVWNKKRCALLCSKLWWIPGKLLRKSSSRTVRATCAGKWFNLFRFISSISLHGLVDPLGCLYMFIQFRVFWEWQWASRTNKDRCANMVWGCSWWTRRYWKTCCFPPAWNCGITVPFPACQSYGQTIWWPGGSLVACYVYPVCINVMYIPWNI